MGTWKAGCRSSQIPRYSGREKQSTSIGKRLLASTWRVCKNGSRLHPASRFRESFHRCNKRLRRATMVLPYTELAQLLAAFCSNLEWFKFSWRFETRIGNNLHFLCALTSTMRFHSRLYSERAPSRITLAELSYGSVALCSFQSWLLGSTPLNYCLSTPASFYVHSTRIPDNHFFLVRFCRCPKLSRCPRPGLVT